MNLIPDKISRSYAQKLPFVGFRKPGESKVTGYFCRDATLTYTSTFEEEGFVFAPFDNTNSSIVFLKESCEVVVDLGEIKSEKGENELETLFSDKEAHLKLTRKGVEAIEENQFKKVVLSRKEVVTMTSVEIDKIFKELLVTYKNAFVYVWYHPQVGLWMGATPERLITLDDGEFKTMALAGTQPYQGNLNPAWGEKEKKEHQYVVDYIVSQIKKNALKEFSVSETYTARAGNLLHLRADIVGKVESTNLKELLNTLHPTPAVCGLPKEEAKEFILKYEGYDRKFYTGFLGEVNTGLKTALFVNLRCVEFLDTSVIIYVGGGITLESNPEKEWEETLLKTQTIKSIL